LREWSPRPRRCASRMRATAASRKRPRRRTTLRPRRGAGERRGQGAPQHPLAPAPHLVAPGQPEGPLDQARVEERHPRLQARGHRHAVDLGEHLVHERGREVGAQAAVHLVSRGLGRVAEAHGVGGPGLAGQRRRAEQVLHLLGREQVYHLGVALVGLLQQAAEAETDLRGETGPARACAAQAARSPRRPRGASGRRLRAGPRAPPPRPPGCRRCRRPPPRATSTAEVDDGVPAVREPERAVDVEALVVGAAVARASARRRRSAGSARSPCGLRRPAMPHMALVYPVGARRPGRRLSAAAATSGSRS
jgi:hypothetical protein